MLKLSTLVFFAALGVFGVSSRNIGLALDRKASFIYNIWITLSLNHPEFAEKLQTELTEDQQELFIEISTSSYYCLILNVVKDYNMETCLKNLMVNYDPSEMQKIDELIKVVQKVEKQLPTDEVRIVTGGYDHIFKFYTKLVQEISRGMKLLNRFTDKEKDFVEAWVEKYNHWFFHITDMSAFVDFVTFQRDNEMFQRVYEKVQSMERELKSDNTDLNEESLGDPYVPRNDPFVEKL